MTIQRTCGVLLGFACSAWSQYVVDAHSGVIQFTTGEVFAGGQPVRAAPPKFPEMQLGETLRTGHGRVEVLLGEAVFLRLGQQSSVHMLSSRLEDTRLEVTSGKVLVEVVALNKGGRIQIQLGNTTTEFKRMGVYRFDLPQGEVRVFGGEAEVSAGEKTVDLTKGKSVRCDSDLIPQKFDLKKTDSLHEWSARRSFLIFLSNLQGRRGRFSACQANVSPLGVCLSGLPLNWEVLYNGSALNRDFDRKYFPRGAARQFIRNQDQTTERQPN